MNLTNHFPHRPRQVRSLRLNSLTPNHRLIWSRRAGFGLNEVIGIAAAVMIAGLVVVPGLRNFASETMDQMTLWWQTMATNIFQS